MSAPDLERQHEARHQRDGGQAQQRLVAVQAFKEHKRYFDSVYLNMVEAGEISGKLDVFLDRLVEMLEKQQAIKAGIKSAMFYPVTLVVITVGISYFMLTNVVPTFQDMYEGLGAELPEPTQAIVNASNWIRTAATFSASYRSLAASGHQQDAAPVPSPLSQAEKHHRASPAACRRHHRQGDGRADVAADGELLAAGCRSSTRWKSPRPFHQCPVPRRDVTHHEQDHHRRAAVGAVRQRKGVPHRAVAADGRWRADR